jgi:site-specific DNA recombinase
VIAAIYARKSNVDERTAEDGKSIDRQIHLAREFAEAKGWAVGEIHQDDGKSGADFTRAGLVALLAGAKAKRFGAVVLMGLDRLGREQTDVAKTLQTLTRADVGVWTYATGQQVKFDDSISKLMANIGSFGAENYREQIKLKTREALREKAKKGHQASGRTYGYDRVQVGDHVEKRVNDEQAAIVKRIFQLAADGLGDDRIAAALVKDGTPSPGSRWTKRPVRTILGNEIYIGRVTYGRTKNVDNGAGGERVKVPKAEWITVSIPELRIIDDATWTTVQARKAKTRSHYLRADKGRLASQPESGIISRYLLTGFLRCAVCGGSMTVVGERSKPRYYCLSRSHKGADACSNAGGIPMVSLDEAVIGVLLDEVMADRDRLWRLIAEADAKREAKKSSKTPDPSRVIAKQQGEIDRLIESLATGKGGASITQAIESRESRIALLKAEAAAVVEPIERAAFLSGWERFRILINKRHPDQVRQLLRKLGCERIEVTKTATGWDFSGSFDAGRFVDNGPSDSSGGVMRLM